MKKRRLMLIGLILFIAFALIAFRIWQNISTETSLQNSVLEAVDEASSEVDIPNAGTQTYDGNLILSETPPGVVVQTTAPLPTNVQLRESDGLWRSDELIALVEKDQWVEVDCLTPTNAVGVQFLGDENDGWARILVDNELWWEGNTFGAVGVGFKEYIQIPNLPNEPHTIRVESVGRQGIEGGDIHVAVPALGCGSLMDTALYLPIITQ